MKLSVFTKNDRYLMLAFDHRDSFKKFINPNDPNKVTNEQAIAIKKQILEAVIDKTSGVLIDQDFGLPAYDQIIEENPERAKIPFLLPTEKSGYAKGINDEENERITQIQYPAESIRNNSAKGVKLLVYFNPTLHSAQTQLITSKIVLDNTHLNDLPLFLEIVTYNKGETPLPQPNTLVANSVKMFLDNNIKPDVFKLEYPGNAEECKKITDMLAPLNIPWILLTRGVDFEEFCIQLETAKQNGCVGFLAGRSVWKEATQITDPKEKEVFFTQTLPQRFERICNIMV